MNPCKYEIPSGNVYGYLVADDVMAVKYIVQYNQKYCKLRETPLLSVRNMCYEGYEIKSKMTCNLFAIRVPSSKFVPFDSQSMQRNALQIAF